MPPAFDTTITYARPIQHFDYFEADVTGHSWANSYLLALASLYMYENQVGATGYTDFRTKYEAKFKNWGMYYAKAFSSTTTGTEYGILSNSKVVIVAFRGTETKIEDWLTKETTRHFGFKPELTFQHYDYVPREPSGKLLPFVSEMAEEKSAEQE